MESLYYSKYFQHQLIGRGHYGKVYLVQNKKTNQLFVSKKIQFSEISQQQIQNTMKQVEIHKKLRHKNILQFKEYFIESNILNMIMDYCEFGDLAMYINNRKQNLNQNSNSNSKKKNQYFAQSLIINLFIQMLFGLNYLHQNKIIHRDIKPQNIFIDSQGIVKLADFGISKMLNTTMQLASTLIGTPFYISPQACSNLGYNYKSDIWSLGCVLYELCTLEHPFKGNNILLIAKKITLEQPNPIPQFYSKDLQNLISKMMRKNPVERPTIKEILQLKFLKQYITQFKMQDQHIKNNKLTISRHKSNIEQERQYFPIYQTQTNLQQEYQNQNYQIENEKIQFKSYLDSKYINNNSIQVKKKHDNLDSTLGSSQFSLSNSHVQSSHISQKNCPNKYNSISQKLQHRLIQRMGQDLFQQIYNFIRLCQYQNLQQKEIQQILRKKYGKNKKQYQYTMDIAQLIYLQDMQNQK